MIRSNPYHSVFGTTDPQNNRNQFEIPQPKTETVTVDQTSASIPPNPVDTELVLKFLDVVSKDPVNEHKSSKEKFEIALEMVKSLK